MGLIVHGFTGECADGLFEGPQLGAQKECHLSIPSCCVFLYLFCEEFKKL